MKLKLFQERSTRVYDSFTRRSFRRILFLVSRYNSPKEIQIALIYKTKETWFPNWVVETKATQAIFSTTAAKVNMLVAWMRISGNLWPVKTMNSQQLSIAKTLYWE